MNALYSLSAISCRSVTSWTLVISSWCQTAPSLSFTWKCCPVPLFILHSDIIFLFTVSCKVNWMKKCSKIASTWGQLTIQCMCAMIWDLPHAAGLRDKPECFHKRETRLWKSRNLTVSIAYTFSTMLCLTSTIGNVRAATCLCGFEQGENHNSVLDTTLRSTPDEQVSIISRYKLHCSKVGFGLNFSGDHASRFILLKHA